MYGAAPCVRVVDDDAAVLKSLDRLLRAAGFAVRTFPSSNEFLQQHDGDAPGCVVLDLSMPGLNGLQLQQALARFETPCPVIFITGNGDVPASVQAMKAGAVDFLLKPFDQSQLLNAVRAAIELDRSTRAERAQRSSLGALVAALTPREREVMALVVSGLLNKQVAGDLGISEITVKAHRGQVMRKMKADSLPDLVTMAARLGLSSAQKH
jgi:FixJ family two-component response regulator